MMSVSLLAPKWGSPPPIGTRPLPARASVMAAAEALLEYACVGRTDNDRVMAQWGSAGQTEAIELGDRGRLQFYGRKYFRVGISIPIKTRPILYRHLWFLAFLASLKILFA